MIFKLPHWVLVNKFPAFFDSESLTAVEQTARLYGKVNELIDSYNKYVEEINKTVNEFELAKQSDVEDFICRISCLTDNYINTVDMRIAHQDRRIAEIYTQFKDDVVNTIRLLISDLKESGELDNAIYEAMDNINTKVDNFIAEMNTKQAELEADYTAKKTALDSDYATVKGNLETDYQETKTQLDSDYTAKKTALDSDYATVKDNLETDYQETKTQLDSDYTAKKTTLDSDYETVKGNLENDYQETKTQLETDYTNKKSSLENSVKGYTDMYNNKNAVLFDGSGDGASLLTTGSVITNLNKYTIVGVRTGCGEALAFVQCFEDGHITITGAGGSSLSGGETALFTDIYIEVDANGVVTKNDTTSYNVIGDGSCNFMVVIKIIGII